MTFIWHPEDDLFIYEVRGEWPAGNGPEPVDGFHGFWVEGGYTFFFFDRESENAMKRLLGRAPDMDLRHVHRMKYADWQDGADFAPFEVGPLTIVPPQLEDLPAGPGVVRLDPGLAFGFGGHPTTRACLEALVRVFQDEPPRRVLDLGTGTGILALAALSLGAETVRAVEYSHLAAETARKNAVLNRVTDRMTVIHGSAEDHAAFPAELVCSNLHLPVQEAILAGGGFAGRRWLILSGMFHRQAEQLEAALAARGCRLVDRVRDERWSTLLFRSGDSGQT